MNKIVISDGKVFGGATHVVEVNSFTNYSEALCSCGWEGRAAGKDELDDKINAHVNTSLKSNYNIKELNGGLRQA